jgi:hypothetical protein
VDGHVVSSNVERGLSTAPQLSISQKVLGTLPEDSNVMPKHVGATIVGFSRIFLVGILIFKGLTARRLYKSFGVKRDNEPKFPKTFLLNV